MSVIIEKKDILNIAIQIEENGEKFYYEAAKSSNTPEIQELFSILAKDESKHRETFSNMLKDLSIQTEDMSPEYQAYLKAYTERLVFDKTSTEVAEGIKHFDQIGALNYATERELDSILYYYELRNMVSGSERDLIDKIILEERRHFERLFRIKNIITSK